MRSSTDTSTTAWASMTARFDLSKWMVYIIFAFVVVVFSLWQGATFLSLDNLLNIARQTAMISIMAVAMTFVIAASGIDLSVSGVVPMSALFAAFVLRDMDNLFLAVLIPLVFGAVVGLVNGALTTLGRIPPFLATLGMMGILKGLAMWISETKAIPIYNDTFTSVFGYENVGPVPILLVWTALAAVIGHFALRQLPFGRRVLAVGGNPIAAGYTGIRVNWVLVQTYVLSGIAAAFAGLLYAGRTETARYTFGLNDELNVIAAVVLGGTAMAGGKASIIGAIVGSLLMGIINNGLIIGGLDVSQQQVVRGFIIIAAVALSNFGSAKGRA